ncbi:hypothetical protein LTR53_009377, partial [Teratosphaeriaceae sp. CCFEE 6253]
TAAVAALPEPVEITREEAIGLVDTYDSPSDLWDKPEHNSFHRTPSPTQAPPPTPADKGNQHMPLAPRLVITPEQEDKPPRTLRAVLDPEDADHCANLRSFRRLLNLDLGRVSLGKFWQTFETLRTPRLRYLTDNDVRRAFRHLSWVEHRHTENIMPRYFALLEECIAEGIHVRTAEWNTAIVYAGRYVRYTTSKELKFAVETWMWMERQGKSASAVTFNILFDVAVKAGRFALADTIFQELRARDLPLTRYFRTSVIYFAGMRGDGYAVRKAFQDLVNAGEIVDTVVMNCVIVSLVRAGEPASAENVFTRMKGLVEQKLGGADAVRGWRERRVLGNLLYKTAAELRRGREAHEQSFFGSSQPAAADQQREEVQKSTSIAPDAKTYRILIQHHAYASGDLARIRELLAEMADAGLHVHGSVYTHLLRGFWKHGGFAYTAWDQMALQAVWEEFTLAMSQSTKSASATASAVEDDDDFDREQSEEDRAPYFTLTLALAAIRAWYKCAGLPRMLEVWQEIRSRWDKMSVDDREVVQKLVDRLVGEGNIYVVP